jgi:hypothetical protein
MVQDYEHMLLTLEATHPNLYAYISEDDFKKETNSLRLSINKSTEIRDFYIILLKTVSLVRQGHTAVFTDFGFSKILHHRGIQFPYKIEYCNNHVYVAENYSLVDTMSIGTEIIAINNTPITMIIEDFKPLLRTRPNGSIGKELSLVWSKYLWLIIGESNNYTIDFIRPFGNEIERTIVNGANGDLKKQKNRVKRTNSFSFNKSDDIAIFSLNTFDLNYQEFDSILTSGFREIESQGINNLIIDIRKNSGGNSSFIVPLMDYLTDKPYYQLSKSEVKTSEAAKLCFTTNPIFINAIKQARKAEKDSEKIDLLEDCYLNKPFGTLTAIKQNEEIPTKDKEYRFRGQLYLLTSNSTFSAATGFASVIKDYSIGSIIGEETSDNPTDYGSIILFDLPNSKVTIQNSTEYTVRPAGFDDEHGVLPDYLISRTYSDLISGYDRVMDYATWMIKNTSINKEKTQ